jgi:hypothetical protein
MFAVWTEVDVVIFTQLSRRNAIDILPTTRTDQAGLYLQATLVVVLIGYLQQH